MNGELSTWAIQPSRLGSYSFPGLPPAPPNLEEHWIDLEYEIAGLLLRIRRRLSRKLTAAVRAAADQADQAALAALVQLAESLR